MILNSKILKERRNVDSNFNRNFRIIPCKGLPSLYHLKCSCTPLQCASQVNVQLWPYCTVQEVGCSTISISVNISCYLLVMIQLTLVYKCIRSIFDIFRIKTYIKWIYCTHVCIIIFFVNSFFLCLQIIFRQYH